MKKHSFLVLILLGLLAAVVVADNERGKAKITWEKNYDVALKNAQTTGKLVLVFSTCDC
ncbi:MAG: hypothetical protein HY811_10325 [Planctomycetes bacterium]|nr:hypothetical protein [Planctomycetota bacterium]